MACKVFLKFPNGKKMPALGYGTFLSTDPQELEVALDAALEAGYRHIDCAQAYENEHVIGKVLKRWLDSGKLKREDLFITTKFHFVKGDLTNVEELTKESLEKLQLDYVDLYLVHVPMKIVIDGTDIYGDPNIHYLDIYKKLEEQYDAGRVKALGVSNFTKKQLENLLKNCRIKPVNHQIEMHVYLQQRGMVDLCKENNITVVAYSPLASPGINVFLESRNLPTKTLPSPLTDKIVSELAKKHSKTPAQILFRFLVQLGVAPIPKSISPKRIKENIDIFDFNLDPQDLEKLRSLEVGLAARVCDLSAFGRAPDHPEYPYGHYP